MRLFRGSSGWVTAYVLSALPGILFALLMLLFWGGGVSWHAQRAGGNFDLLHLALFPFYLVVFAGSFRRAHDPPPTPSEIRLRAGMPAPLVVFFGFIALFFLVGWLGDPEEDSPVARNEKATTGCTNYPRELSTKTTGALYVVVYDRYCKAAPKRTVNVSVQRETEPQGPGNVFVAEVPEGRSSHGLDAMALLGAGGDIQIVYDPSLRVLRRASTLNGAAITFTPASGSSRSPRPGGASMRLPKTRLTAAPVSAYRLQLWGVGRGVAWRETAASFAHSSPVWHPFDGPWSQPCLTRRALSTPI